MAPASARETQVNADRTIAFSDGVFAVAITLLVVQIGVPRRSAGSDAVSRAISDAAPELLSYFIAFALIGLFWYAHHLFFNSLTAIDGRLIFLNLVYLSFIALMPFPTAIYGDHGSSEPAVALFASVIAIAGLIGTLMLWAALDSGLLPPAQVARKWILIAEDLITPSLFALSVPVALLGEPGVAPYMWLGVAIIPRLLRRRGLIERF
ncbi:MAG: TMEM175 family protein [Solirubrobacteraceae bacterium]